MTPAAKELLRSAAVIAQKNREPKVEEEIRKTLQYAQTQRPLFIPLKKEFFEKFLSGIKTIEYRPYGPRWNEVTCRIGREVLLSCGYGKQKRLHGHIADFWCSATPWRIPGWAECYGRSTCKVACIEIAVPGGGQ